MTATRRAKRANQRANEIHNPVLTPMLVQAAGYLSAITEDNIESTQFILDDIQMDWRRYCNNYRRDRTGLPPDIDAFVNNLVNMIRI